MSLYNQIMGFNPATPIVLKVLDLAHDAVPRLRDCYIAEEGCVVGVYTRTGGGNRASYEEGIDALKAHEWFDREFDDERDSTFMSFEFRLPDGHPAIRALAAIYEHERYAEFRPHPTERFWAMLEKLKDPSQADDPEVKRAVDLGKRIFDQLDESDGPKIIEV